MCNTSCNIWRYLFSPKDVFIFHTRDRPISMAKRSEARVCGLWLAGIVVSNSARGMDVCCECCVMSGRGLCDGPITRPEESYRLWCVIVCDKVQFYSSTSAVG